MLGLMTDPEAGESPHTVADTARAALRPRTPATLVWFRRDLRLADHPALGAAVVRSGPIVPVFIWAPEEEGRWSPGPAARTWLAASLRHFDDQLRTRGSRLILRGGPTVQTLLELAAEVGAGAVAWNRALQPAILERDARVARSLRAAGVVVLECEPDLLHDPESLHTTTGGGFRVFTPFYRALLSRPAPAPTPAPSRLAAPACWPSADPRWSGASSAAPSAPTAWIAPPPGSSPPPAAGSWDPGLQGAERRTAHFLAVGLAGYPRDRDFPAFEGTSRLSPHLAMGEIGPRRLWSLAEEAGRVPGACFAVAAGAEAFRRQLAWREFAYHLLVHAPTTPEAPLRAEFARFPWEDDPTTEAMWAAGRTGYPLVDAGIRQLLASGWMHNRVRMVVASFLVKDLLVPWQHGARFFWEQLIDADLANNTLGWQWVAGSGADAAPFFRVFNPVLQGRRYDPAGAYVRRWVPEIAGLPDRFVHAPWIAPDWVLSGAGVRLGETYPPPVLDHGEARRRALAAFAQMRGA